MYSQQSYTIISSSFFYQGLRKYMCNAYPRRYARSMPKVSSKFVDENGNNGPLRQYKTTLHTLMSSISDRNGAAAVRLPEPSYTRVESGDHGVDSQRQVRHQQLLERDVEKNKERPANQKYDNADDGMSIYDRYSDVVDLNRPKEQMRIQSPQVRNSTPTETRRKFPNSEKSGEIHDLHLHVSDEDEEITFNHPLNSSSEQHPDPRHVAPSMTVISSCMSSLKQHPGVRLYAHGTKCQPRKVWIRLDSAKDALIWRTENTSVASPKTAQSLGQAHEIFLLDLLYVDIGKTTASLKAIPEENIPEDLCFSLLSKQGSLDLNAKTALERNALVSCLCLILDERCSRQQSKNDGPRSHWRTLYKSVVASADKGSDIVGDCNESLTFSSTSIL
jgi:hypothetical protein